MPSVPTIAKATAPTLSNAAGGVKLTWTKVSNITGYKVYRDGKLVKTISTPSTTSFTDSGAKTNGKKYTYTITYYVTKDGKTYEGAKSNSASITFLLALY